MLQREPIENICTYTKFANRVLEILKKHDKELLCPVTPRIIKDSKSIRFQIETSCALSIYLDDVAIIRNMPTNRSLTTFRLGVTNDIRHLLFSLCAAIQSTLVYRQYAETVIEKGLWDSLYDSSLRKHEEYRYRAVSITRESSHEVTFTIKGDTDSHVNGIIFNTTLLGE
jgi:hypothetical protein